MRIRGALLIAIISLLGCRGEREETPAETAAPPSAAPSVARMHGVQIDHAKVLRPHAVETLSLRVYDDAGHLDEELRSLDGAPLHLVVVDRALGWFQHVHPAKGAHGYDAPISFPRAGEYVAFSYYEPADGEVQVSRSELAVGAGSSNRSPQTLSLTPRLQRHGRYAVELIPDPDPPRSGTWTTLTFRITFDGEPVAVSVSSARSHVAVISAGAAELLYAHSTLGEAMGGMRGEMHIPIDPLHGDETIHTPIRDGRISYHVKLPHPGRYKVWIASVPEAPPLGFVFDARRAIAPD